MAEAYELVLTGTITGLAQTAGVPVTRGCGLVGMARSTFYRWTRNYSHYRPVTDPVPQSERYQPAALTGGERDEILAVIEREEYEDLSVVQTYWRAFDDGLVACSERTFYRVADAAGLVGDRRSTRKPGQPGSRRKPVVWATVPGELWSWDITELAGPGQQRYKLYLVLDVYSRYPIAYRVEHSESKELAVAMFTTAINQHGIPTTVHADNGGAMRSHLLVDALTVAGVVTSFSRPRVWDNAMAESFFATLKTEFYYRRVWPTMAKAKIEVGAWIEDRYNRQRRYSALGQISPVTFELQYSNQTAADPKAA